MSAAYAAMLELVTRRAAACMPIEWRDPTELQALQLKMLGLRTQLSQLPMACSCFLVQTC